VRVSNSDQKAYDGYEPVNYQSRSADQIDQSVDYAFQALQNYESLLKRLGLTVDNCRIVELGPGSSIGAQLILASLGASITLVDRFLPKWDPNFHPKLYSAIARRWTGAKDQLSAVIDAGTHDAANVRLLEEPAEAIQSIPDGSVDLIISNAVLEHVFDISRVAAENFRILRPAGGAAHQIDMRDHRDFSRPLEHLLMDERSFAVSAEDSHYEFGNRLRFIELCAQFESAGFTIVDREINGTAAVEYLSEFVPRLRGSRSAYRDWPEDDLVRTSCLLLLRKDRARADSAQADRAREILGNIDARKAASMDAVEVREPPAVEFEISPRSMRNQKGYLWKVSLPGLPVGDTMPTQRSPLALLEDGASLGPGHVPHALIAAKGSGRFSHWYQALYFSSSDNSSPRDNGRRYAVRLPTPHPAKWINYATWIFTNLRRAAIRLMRG
jgi:SAM-dependent methyltransferase